MASGDLVAGPWNVHGGTYPTSNFPQPDWRNAHATLRFDASTKETAYFDGVLDPKYSGGGLRTHLSVAATSATSGVAKLLANIERVNSGGPDIDADSFSATDGTVSITASGTSGIPTEGTIDHSSGANMDSLAAGEPFRLRVERDAANAADTMTGDAELLTVWITEI